MCDETQKTCARCGEVKDLSAFPDDNRTQGGKRKTCQACITEATRQGCQAKGYKVDASIALVLQRLRAGRTSFDVFSDSGKNALYLACKKGWARQIMTKPLKSSQKRGVTRLVSTGMYEITELGLKVCPWRNPAARDRIINIPRQGDNVRGPTPQPHQKVGTIVGAYA